MSDLAEVAARGTYAKNGWWRPVTPGDDGKGRYRDGGTMTFRAVEWDDLDDEERGGLILDAHNALAAIEKAGHRIVPVEPTKKMNDAGWLTEDHDGWDGPRDCWDAMLAAAPKVTP